MVGIGVTGNYYFYSTHFFQIPISIWLDVVSYYFGHFVLACHIKFCQVENILVLTKSKRKLLALTIYFFTDF